MGPKRSKRQKPAAAAKAETAPTLPAVRPTQHSAAGRAPPEIIEAILHEALDVTDVAEHGAAKRSFKLVAARWREAIRLLSDRRVIVYGLRSARQLVAACKRSPERASRIISMRLNIGGPLEGASDPAWIAAVSQLIVMSAPSLRILFVEGRALDRIAVLTDALAAGVNLRCFETTMSGAVNSWCVIRSVQHGAMRTFKAADVEYQWWERTRVLFVGVHASSPAAGHGRPWEDCPETEQILALQRWVQHIDIEFSPCKHARRPGPLINLITRPGVRWLSIGTHGEADPKPSAPVLLDPRLFDALPPGLPGGGRRRLELGPFEFGARDSQTGRIRPWTMAEADQAHAACASRGIAATFYEGS